MAERSFYPRHLYAGAVEEGVGQRRRSPPTADILEAIETMMPQPLHRHEPVAISLLSQKVAVW